MVKYTQNALDKCVVRTIAPHTLANKSYFVPPVKYSVKLDAMESPFELPVADRNSLWQEATKIHLNRYPDAYHTDLKAAVKSFFGIKNADLDVLLGNGSDELIQLLIISQIGLSRTIMAPDPSFVMYRLISEHMHLPFATIPLSADFSLQFDVAMATITDHNPGLIFIAQPNNPTGKLFAQGTLKKIISSTEALVVLDEAYFAFHDMDYIPWLESYPNLLLLRTFSKAGFAALRLGCIIGHTAWIAEFNKLRLPYNISSITQQLGIHILQEKADIVRTQCEEIIQQRTQLVAELSKLPNVSITPSAANFITIATPKGSAKEWYNKLLAKQIIIKNLHTTHPLLDNCLRITVGNPSECAKLLEVLTELAHSVAD